MGGVDTSAEVAPAAGSIPALRSHRGQGQHRRWGHIHGPGSDRCKGCHSRTSGAFRSCQRTAGRTIRMSVLVATLPGWCV